MVLTEKSCGRRLVWFWVVEKKSATGMPVDGVHQSSVRSFFLFSFSLFFVLMVLRAESPIRFEILMTRQRHSKDLFLKKKIRYTF
jgi:hypothetical protein